jgi:hypothetical protein
MKTLQPRQRDATTGKGLEALRNTLTDEAVHALVCLEKADLVLAELAEDYFNETVNDPDTPEGRENIVTFFGENHVRAHIVRDYVAQLRATLDNVASLVADRVEVEG